MKPHNGKISGNYIKAIFSACAILAIAAFASCSKSDGYSLTGTKITAVIQINANTTAYSLASAPDVISFTTAAVDASVPNFREYTVKGINTNSTVSFSLVFHIDSVGSGKYVMEGSQLIAGSKSYLSFASKATDKVNVVKLDNTNKVYKGTFSFYAFNQALSTDSVLVTGTYSLE